MIIGTAKNSRPRVSIGLPVYNGARYLVEALEAIQAQTYPDFELVITDNDSTDATADIANQYARNDRRIRYIRNETNLGVSGNFNRAFELSRGELFKWQAYDDLLAPRFLATCIERLNDDPDLAVCHTLTQRIGEDGCKINMFEREYELDSPEPSRRFYSMIWASAFPPIFGLMRSDIVRQTGLFGQIVGADRIFLAELLLAGGCAYVPEELFSIRVHPGAYTHNVNTYQEQQQWYAPRNGGSTASFMQLPRTAAAFAAAIRRSPVRGSQRTKAYGYLAAWTSHCVRQLVERRLGFCKAA